MSSLPGGTLKQEPGFLPKFVQGSLPPEAVELVRSLLAQGHDVHETDSRGQTALHWCAAFGKIEMLGVLLEAGADPDRRMDTGKTPLHMAVTSQQLEAVDRLLQGGANPEVLNAEGLTALSLACLRSDPELILRLLEAGASVQPVETCPATRNLYRSKDPAAALREALKDPEVARVLRTSDGKRRNLWNLTEAREFEAIARLCEAGLSPNATDIHAYGRTPFSCAVYDQSEELIVRLLDVGGDWREGLYTAASAGRMSVVRLLLSRSPLPQPDDGSLMRSATYGKNLELLQVLRDAGAAIEAGEGQQPPLVEAVLFSTIEVVRWLLEAGAEPNRRSTLKGKRALHFAAEKGRADVIEALLSRGASVEAVDDTGLTARMLAASQGHADAERLLGTDSTPREDSSQGLLAKEVYAEPPKSRKRAPARRGKGQSSTGKPRPRPRRK
jgi:ankyrin repeat protein